MQLNLLQMCQVAKQQTTNKTVLNLQADRFAYADAKKEEILQTCFRGQFA